MLSTVYIYICMYIIIVKINYIEKLAVYTHTHTHLFTFLFYGFHFSVSILVNYNNPDTHRNIFFSKINVNALNIARLNN